mmetsp:Transcript_35754/g.54751  ORF Transcript_35754/g.54751 Transcript_35754/m.54751 type:complete len:109 (+) Transcript_35754:1-327(+)
MDPKPDHFLALPEKVSAKNKKRSRTVDRSSLGKYKDKDCPVCLVIMIEPITLDKCGHRFCGGCLKRYMNLGSKCPLCRQSITFKETSWKERVDTVFQQYLKESFPLEY